MPSTTCRRSEIASTGNRCCGLELRSFGLCTILVDGLPLLFTKVVSSDGIPVLEIDVELQEAIGEFRRSNIQLQARLHRTPDQRALLLRLLASSLQGRTSLFSRSCQLSGKKATAFHLDSTKLDRHD